MLVTREQLEKEEKNPCKCGHRRLQHFVGGPISDCDKCGCKEYTPQNQGSN
jgi:hypothetical protein